MALIQIVEWNKNLDPSDIFAWRYLDPKKPGDSDALGNWTQLIVQESHEAILFRDGQALDLFGPGRYTLSTDNIPILGRLINLPTGGQSPFKASVWYVNKLHVLDVKWGTTAPLLLRDPEYRVAVPVRAYGQFGVKIKDSRKFLLKLVGVQAQLKRDYLINAFRALILNRIGDMIATYMVEKKVSIFDISVYLKDMSQEALEEISPTFDEYGIEALNFYIESVNVPEDDPSVIDLRQAMSERARMDVIGYNYQQKRSFDTMESMAGASGGGNPLIGAGIGMGVGMGVGGAFTNMAQNMGQNLNVAPQQGQAMQQQNTAQPNAKQTSIFCPKCGKQNPEGTRFCQVCGTAVVNVCPSCNTEVSLNARFCPKCGKDLPKVCECGEPLPKHAAFCSKCGRKVSGDN